MCGVITTFLNFQRGCPWWQRLGVCDVHARSGQAAFVERLHQAIHAISLPARNRDEVGAPLHEPEFPHPDHSFRFFRVRDGNEQHVCFGKHRIQHVWMHVSLDDVARRVIANIDSDDLHAESGGSLRYLAADPADADDHRCLPVQFEHAFATSRPFLFHLIRDRDVQASRQR